MENLKLCIFVIADFLWYAICCWKVINVYSRINVNRCGNSDCEIGINCFKNDCISSKFSIQILEKLPGNGYRNGAVDSQMLEYTLQLEKPHTCSLILSFRSIFLNVCLKLRLAVMVLRCHLL